MRATLKPYRKGLAAAGIGVAVVLVAVGTTLTLTPATGGASAGKPSAQYLASARSALVRYLQHNDAPASHARIPGSEGGFGTLRPINNAGSFNWSGYVDTDATAGYFKSVSGDWTTPSVTASCTHEDTVAAQWIGLDGWSNTTVEQEGVIDWCFEDHATYYTWYEMYPAGSVEVGKTLLPGDKIATSITRTGTSYKMVLTDSTHTANSFTKTLTCAAATCKDTSAEWIDERPDFTSKWLRSAGRLRDVDPDGGHRQGRNGERYGDQFVQRTRRSRCSTAPAPTSWPLRGVWPRATGGSR